MNIDHIMNAEERREAFREAGFRYGDNEHYWDYADVVAEILSQALEHVEGLIGPDSAARPLRELVDPIAVISNPRADDWREVMEDTLAAGTTPPISDRLDAALLYGLYGVTPVEIPVEDRTRWIATLVDDVSRFASRSEVRSLGDGDNAVLRIANLAASRHALDRGEGEVDIASMVILGAISESRVRNLMSGASAQLERGPGGGVKAMSALTWLQKRKGFLHSIWSSEDRDDHGPEAPLPPVALERLIFVPVARDGSLFHPDLVRGGKYQIGAKGEEQHFDNFDDALTALNAMPVPRWRRPNEQGHWGIVSGVAWQRVERQK